MPYAKLRTNSKSVISVIHCTFSGLSVFVDPISFFTGYYQYNLRFLYKTGVLCRNKPDFRVYFEDNKKHLAQPNIHFWTKKGLKSSGCQMIGIWYNYND